MSLGHQKKQKQTQTIKERQQRDAQKKKNFIRLETAVKNTVLRRFLKDHIFYIIYTQFLQYDTVK